MAAIKPYASGETVPADRHGLLMAFSLTPNLPKRPLSPRERAGVRARPTSKPPAKRKGETWRPPLEFLVLSHRS